jgi:Inorganic pyrophosphatase/exopolyphosphatase
MPEFATLRQDSKNSKQERSKIVRKGNKTIVVTLLVIAACLIAAGGFFIGKTAGEKPLLESRERLYALNRASIEKMSIEESPVYVIGHRSPDSDTVCSAIAYARLLNLLGYPAEAAVNGPVNKETAFILSEAGVEAPPVLEDAAGKSIFLVDHSEYAQSTEGLEDAHIVGILDHHGVGTVKTGYQLVYEARPIGATATIVWLDYLNYGLDIDKVTATLLLGAVLSDTVNLTGSITEADRQAVAELADLAGITDVGAFYRALHAEALSYEGMSDEEILFSDYKEYETSGVKYGIGLLSVIDEDAARTMAARMKGALPQGFAAKQVDLMYASVGIRENGLKIDYIIPANEESRAYFEAAFPNYDEYDGTSYIFRNGGLGRKSKFVPGMTDFLSAHPHE